MKYAQSNNQTPLSSNPKEKKKTEHIKGTQSVQN
jgi:hypothetical protein